MPDYGDYMGMPATGCPMSEKVERMYRKHYEKYLHYKIMYDCSCAVKKHSRSMMEYHMGMCLHLSQGYPMPELPAVDFSAVMGVAPTMPQMLPAASQTMMYNMPAMAPAPQATMYTIPTM